MFFFSFGLNINTFLIVKTLNIDTNVINNDFWELCAPPTWSIWIKCSTSSAIGLFTFGTLPDVIIPDHSSRNGDACGMIPLFAQWTLHHHLFVMSCSANTVYWYCSFCDVWPSFSVFNIHSKCDDVPCEWLVQLCPHPAFIESALFWLMTLA